MKNRSPKILEAALNKEKTKLPEGFGAESSLTAVLLVLCAMGVYYYGPRAAAVAFVCAASCLGADIVCLILRKKRLHIHDLSPIVTGLAIACLLPASVPYTIAAGACVFAVCIAKAPFGGRGCEIICPAAAGYIFAELSFYRQMHFYPKPFEPLGLENTVTEPLYRAFSGGVLSGEFSELELLVGSTPGTLGCTGAVTVMVCGAAVIFMGAYPRSVIIPEAAVFLGYIFLFGNKSPAACAVDIFTIAVL
nr:RnfABCDGE type electron transport complex subunit D [Oscillospiraceae bacterium]